MTRPSGAGDPPNLVLALTKSGDLDGAVACSRKMDTSNGPARAAVIGLARKLLQAGRAPEAEQLATGVLDCAPGAGDAHVLLIDVAVAAKDWPEAETRARAAREALPDQPRFGLRLARALRMQDRVAEAVSVLEAYRETAWDNPAYLSALAANYHRLGRLPEADQAVMAALGHMPNDASLRKLWVEIGGDISDGSGQRRAAIIASEISGAAGLDLCRAEMLLSAGDARAASDALAQIAARHPDNAVVRSLLSGASEEAARQAADAAAHAHQPANRAARAPKDWMAAIDAAVEAGDTDAALQLADAAFGAHPDVPRIAVKRCAILRRFGTAAHEMRALNEGRAAHPTHPVLAQLMSEALIRQGFTDEANALWDDVLEAAPDNPLAWQNAARVARSCGVLKRLRPTFEAHFGPSAAADGRDGSLQAMEPKRLLDYVDVLADDRDRAAAKAALVCLDPSHQDLKPPDLLRVFQLAKSLGVDDLGAQVVDRLANQPVLSARVAMFLANQAQLTGLPEVYDRILAILPDRLVDSDARQFRIDAARLNHAPIRAVEYLRTAALRNLSATECRSLATLLRKAGQAPLAIRFARFAQRRWPRDGSLIRTVVQLYYGSGDLDGADRFLDQIALDWPEFDTGVLRAEILFSRGKLEQALALCDQREADGLPVLDLPVRFQIAISSGKVDAARALVARMRDKPGRTARAEAHFRVSLLGSEFEELELFHRATGVTDAAQAPPDTVANFVPAARSLLARTADPAPPELAEAEVPKFIFQYWDSPDIASEMATLMESWQGHNGYRYTCFNKHDARAYLAEHFDRDHVRAFVNTRHPVEESDFFRLCVLLREGGVYADADDQLISDPEGLRAAAGRGLALFLERNRVLANNVIIAAPGHPAIGRAVDMARDALLRHDNDKPWAKTGPGLLSRAVGSYLVDSDQLTHKRDLSILHESWVYPRVNMHVPLPYKDRPGYWKRMQQFPDTPTAAVLKKFVGLG